VLGIKGLRVVDASVLQVRHLSVNHVSLQGMAELASRFIINYWKQEAEITMSLFNQINPDAADQQENNIR